MGSHFSPRFGAVLSVLDKHTVHASYNKAFRNPSLLESFIDVNKFRGGNLTGVHGSTGFSDKDIREGRELDSELIKAYEVGYQGFWFDRMKLQVDGFYTEVEDLISMISLERDTDGFFFNFGGGKNYGVEISSEFIIRKDLRMLVNYTWQDLEDIDFDTASVRERIPTPLPEEEQSWINFSRNEGHAPVHKFNFGLRATIPRNLTTFLNVHYVSTSENWYASYITPQEQPNKMTAGTYTIANLALTYRFSQNLDFTVTVQNLLDNRHFEYPDNNYSYTNSLRNLNIVESEEIGRLWLIGAKLHF